VIPGRLGGADRAPLLVSIDFINSKYCYDVELEMALELHEERKLKVIPVILCDCLWSHSPFAKLQALPKDGKAGSRWNGRDEALADVVEGVKLVAEGILKSRSLSDCRLELRNLSWVSSTSPPCARSALPINPGRAFRSLLSARALQQNFRARTVIMGSRSDRATMWCAAETLDELGGGRGARIASAHRPRDCLVAFAEEPGLRGRRRRRGSPRAGADGSGVDSRPARKRMNEMSEHAGWS
jgi:hypothetical protein